MIFEGLKHDTLKYVLKAGLKVRKTSFKDLNPYKKGTRGQGDSTKRAQEGKGTERTRGQGGEGDRGQQGTKRNKGDNMEQIGPNKGSNLQV